MRKQKVRQQLDARINTIQPTAQHKQSAGNYHTKMDYQIFFFISYFAIAFAPYMGLFDKFQFVQAIIQHKVTTFNKK